jgi:DNA replication protein DnaC
VLRDGPPHSVDFFEPSSVFGAHSAVRPGARHSHKRSTVITTNTPFSDWGNILFNTTIATAIADRLVENSEIFLLGGDSLRKANKNPEPPAE